MNQELRFKNSKKGFTLIEILVAIAITAVVGAIMVAIFANTLRGSNKSQIVSVIKQNGQAVMENMSKVIRGSSNVIYPVDTNPSKTLVVENVVGTNRTYTRYRFIDPVVPTANGQIQQDNPTPTASETEKDFFDRMRDPTDIMDAAHNLNFAILTDINTQTGVSVASSSFKRSILAGYKDSVTVSFQLGPGVQAPSVIAGQIDAVTFQTTLQLR